MIQSLQELEKEAGAMGQFVSLQTRAVEDFEEFSEVVVGTHREVIQLEDGKLSGHLSHASIGRLRIDLASFNLGVRTKGALVADRIVIGMLANSSNRVTRSSYESQPGDVHVNQAGSEHENRYYSGASVIIASILPEDIDASFASEGALSDPAAWHGGHFRGNAYTVQNVIPRVQSLVASLDRAALNAAAAEFWKRAVIEAMSASILANMSSERNRPLLAALKMVRRVEEYLDERAMKPVHISQICSRLHVSRRTLHRAFHEALGIGPIAFLRHRRLCAVHTALLAKDTGTISDIALQLGFQNLGRFAGYYHQLFGEFPSETRQRSLLATTAHDK